MTSISSAEKQDSVDATMADKTLALRHNGYVPCVTSDIAPILEKEAFLFDFDGTVWMGGTMIEGVVDTIQEIRAAGKQPIYLTNNSSKSRNEYLSRLQALNLCDDPREIVMSTDTVTTYLKARGHRSAYIMGTEAMKAMCADNGVVHQDDPSKVEIVVIGFDKTATADKLTFVARLVKRGIPYIVAHPDPFCPSDEGPIVDCGAYHALIRKSTGVDAQAVLGKPAACMIEEVEKRFSIAREKMVIFGDRLYTDIALGTETQVSTVLVLTGENTLADAALSEQTPTWILNSVADLRGKFS